MKGGFWCWKDSDVSLPSVFSYAWGGVSGSWSCGWPWLVLLSLPGPLKLQHQRQREENLLCAAGWALLVKQKDRWWMWCPRNRNEVRSVTRIHGVLGKYMSGEKLVKSKDVFSILKSFKNLVSFPHASSPRFLFHVCLISPLGSIFFIIIITI